MYIEKIDFPPGRSLHYEGWQVGSYHLHTHKGVIEILMVAKGKAKVTMSFECFDLNQGDYIVIRESDSHSFTASDSGCEIISLYFNMDAYIGKFPYLPYVLFGCESFDLAKYRNETAKIRNLILSILIRLIKGDEKSVDEAIQTADSLMWLLVNDYDMIKYYNRKWDASYSKIEKYYIIMEYIFKYYHMKNPQDLISREEHYSKSYITHLFKEVGASSLKDMLDFIRVYHSEEMLINSDLSIHEISDCCGFSDIKYFTSNFKKWFLRNPSEYRKIALKEMNKSSIYNLLTSEQIMHRVTELVRCDLGDSHYQAAINPLSIKLFGYTDLEAQNTEKEEQGTSRRGAEKRSEYFPRRHGRQVPCGEEILRLSNGEFMERIHAYENQSFRSVIMIDRSNLSGVKCREILLKIMENLVFEGDYEIVIKYNDLGQYHEINRLIEDMTDKFEYKDIHPIFFG